MFREVNVTWSLEDNFFLLGEANVWEVNVIATNFFTVSVVVSAAAAGASPASTGVSAVTALITVVVVVIFFSATTAVIGVKVGFGPLGAGVLKPR